MTTPPAMSDDLDFGGLDLDDLAGPCIAAKPDCAECPPPDHDRLDCGEMCWMRARLLSTPEGHKAMHNARRCPRCHAPKDTNERQALCVNRCCVVLTCRRCGTWQGGWGPMDCSCEQRTRPAPRLARRSAARWRRTGGAL